MKKNIDIKDKKVIAILFIAILGIVMIASVIVYKVNTNKLKKRDELTNLTTVYNKKQEEKNNHIPQENGFEKGEAVDQDGNKVVTPSEKFKLDVPKFGTDNVTDDEGKIIENLVMDITEMINKGDTDTLYNMLNENYKKDLTINEQIFKDSYKFEGPVSTRIFKVERSDDLNGIIASVNLTEDNTGLQQIKYFTLFQDGTIADLDIETIQEVNFTVSKDNVNYTTVRRYEKRLSGIYSIKIENNSDYLLDIVDIKTYFNDTEYSNKNISLNSNTQVKPGIPYNLVLEVPNHIGLTEIIVKVKDLEGNIKEIEIY